MTAVEVITILAILAGPVLAVQAQKWIENFREKRNRKLHIFRTLMATRAAKVSAEHVRALNMIDIAFYDDSKVKEAWKEYLDHLYDANYQKSHGPEKWIEKSEELFISLLKQIAEVVGYHFDKTHFKRAVYLPTAHGEQANDLQIIKENMKKILSGEQAVAIKILKDQ